MIIGETKGTISLNNGIDIETITASYRHVRGFSIVSAVADEVAFWWLDAESANSDKEVLNALRPDSLAFPAVSFGLSRRPTRPEARCTKLIKRSMQMRNLKAFCFGSRRRL